MITFVSLCLAALAGAIVMHLLNYKATTNPRMGLGFAIVVGILVFFLLISDDGSAFLIRTFASFNIHLK